MLCKGCKFKDIIEAVGNTPVVKITKVIDVPGVEVYAKLEGYNPGGSVKDRIAKFMIEGAEKDGRLDHKMTIMEPSSGNTGIGLAMICAAKGYKLEIIMPETMSIERRKIIASMGAEIILTPGDEGMNGAIARSDELAKRACYFMPNQFANPDNVRAHYEGTGVEILEQIGHVDVFVAGLGTSGTLMGVGRRLREHNPNIKVIAVQPFPKSKIQGLKSLDEGYIPPIYDESVVTETQIVRDDEAFAMARRLMKEEGVSAGISSGAAIAEAARQAKHLGEGTLVVVLPDRAERYVSTALFE
jgi:cysteine synthase